MIGSACSKKSQTAVVPEAAAPPEAAALPEAAAPPEAASPPEAAPPPAAAPKVVVFVTIYTQCSLRQDLFSVYMYCYD